MFTFCDVILHIISKGIVSMINDIYKGFVCFRIQLKYKKCLLFCDWNYERCD